MPDEPSGGTIAELGYPPRRSGDTEAEKQGLNPYAIIAGPNLKRLRVLYEAAPEAIRRRVPDVRRRMLEGTATDDDHRADAEQEERLLREWAQAGRWKTEVMNEWHSLSEELQDLVIKMSVHRHAWTEKGRASLERLESEYREKRAAVVGLPPIREPWGDE